MRGKGNSVSIVGASVAGLYSAYFIAKKGIPVCIYDASNPFKPSRRTLIVTSDFLNLPNNDLKSLVMHKIWTFELISHSSSVKISLSKPDLIIDRASLIAHLARCAHNSGAKIFQSHYLSDAYFDNGGVHLNFITDSGDRDIFSRVVVGADGVNSRVGSLFGGTAYRRVALLQYPVMLPRDHPPEVTRVWFDCQATPFFIWLIPDSSSTGVAGIIAETPYKAQRALKNFLNCQGLSPECTPQAGHVPLPPFRLLPPKEWANSHVILIGDAAAQVKASTVGGVVAGMRGALAAAQSVNALLMGQPFYGQGGCHLKRIYRREVMPLWRELLAHTIVQRILEVCTDDDYDFLLRSINKPSMKILSRYSRDRLSHTMMLIAISQPRWTALGLKLLLRLLIT